jgi:hypothetical protein
MISKAFGEDWKEKYVVWDNSAGSKNLTRDYYFNELYSSTLEQAELDISAHYNKEATSFQFDFLNDPLDKLPKGLLEAFEQNKPIIIFMNPPYGRAGKSDDGVGAMGIKKGSAMTMVNEQMKKDKIGACSANLYAQFIYRIMMIKRQYNLTNCHIAMFTKPLHLTGETWKQFRSDFFQHYKFCDACSFNASYFADCSDKWGISFSIWKSGVQKENNMFIHTLIDSIEGSIKSVGKKIIYNLDGSIMASKWVSDVKCTKTEDTVTMKSALKIADKLLKTNKQILAWFTNGNNNIYHNSQDVFILPCPNSIGKTNVPILPSNFTRCTSLFSARKLVVGNWINDKDEYMAPDVTNEKWQEFENDSIVYSLFNTSSNQSSLRQVEYKGKLWDIKNEFFWMSREEMMSLANESGNDDCYQDAHVSSDRYVYNLLQGITLSEEAQAVLDKACELVRKTFKYRKLFNEEHENYQINNWDCGWYQIKALAKEYAKDDLEEFKVLYKKLADKMLPMVYEVGFLRK